MEGLLGKVARAPFLFLDGVHQFEASMVKTELPLRNAFIPFRPLKCIFINKYGVGYI